MSTKTTVSLSLLFLLVLIVSYSYHGGFLFVHRPEETTLV